MLRKYPSLEPPRRSASSFASCQSFNLTMTDVFRSMFTLQYVICNNCNIGYNGMQEKSGRGSKRGKGPPRAGKWYNPEHTRTKEEGRNV